MAMQPNKFNGRQLMFKELFVGTLIYAVVLGFFNDYTDIVEARSFSTIFAAALLLELLTYLVLWLKSKVISSLKDKPGAANRSLMFFGVWLIMFSSKFVFIWAVDFTFGNYMNINGFFGVFVLVLSVTILHKLADYTFKSLGDV